ncbi:MAG: hypothetical protein K8S27_06030 [Candidatus Omnitrophica bacterium]|nr:hypothetical protein [Candidatus Omnitrophota bacterium]
MTISDWLAILAIITAPILAVQVQKIIETVKEIKNKKMQIFKALMATRATPLYSAHVEALNMIDIEFYKEKKVVEAWKLLHDNFANYPKDPKAPDFEARLASCGDKSNELLTELLYEMSKVLGYKFDKVLLKRGCYTPKGHGDFQLEQDFIRRGLVQVFLGNQAIPISVTEIKHVENSPAQVEPNNEEKGEKEISK